MTLNPAPLFRNSRWDFSACIPASAGGGRMEVYQARAPLVIFHGAAESLFRVTLPTSLCDADEWPDLHDVEARLHVLIRAYDCADGVGDVGGVIPV